MGRTAGEGHAPRAPARRPRSPITTPDPSYPPSASNLIPVWLQADAYIVRLRVRVQPRASRTEVAGAYGDALRIRVAAPPVDGEANEELVRWLAKCLGVARSRVRIVSGETGRNKVIAVEGVTTAQVERALEAR